MLIYFVLSAAFSWITSSYDSLGGAYYLPSAVFSIRFGCCLVNSRYHFAPCFLSKGTQLGSSTIQIQVREFGFVLCRVSNSSLPPFTVGILFTITSLLLGLVYLVLCPFFAVWVAILVSPPLLKTWCLLLTTSNRWLLHHTYTLSWLVPYAPLWLGVLGFSCWFGALIPVRFYVYGFSLCGFDFAKLGAVHFYAHLFQSPLFLFCLGRCCCDCLSRPIRYSLCRTCIVNGPCVLPAWAICSTVRGILSVWPVGVMQLPRLSVVVFIVWLLLVLLATSIPLYPPHISPTRRLGPNSAIEALVHFTFRPFVCTVFTWLFALLGTHCSLYGLLTKYIASPGHCCSSWCLLSVAVCGRSLL